MLDQAFYVAQHLGQVDPIAMLEGMDPVVYQLWIHYLEASPFGELREDARHGIRASLFVNANRKKGARAVKPGDMVPKWGEEPRKQRTANETRDHLIAVLGAAHGVVYKDGSH